MDNEKDKVTLADVLEAVEAFDSPQGCTEADVRFFLEGFGVSVSRTKVRAALQEAVSEGLLDLNHMKRRYSLVSYFPKVKTGKKRKRSKSLDSYEIEHYEVKIRKKEPKQEVAVVESAGCSDPKRAHGEDVEYTVDRIRSPRLCTCHEMYSDISSSLYSGDDMSCDCEGFSDADASDCTCDEGSSKRSMDSSRTTIVDWQAWSPNDDHTSRTVIDDGPASTLNDGQSFTTNDDSSRATIADGQPWSPNDDHPSRTVVDVGPSRTTIADGQDRTPHEELKTSRSKSKVLENDDVDENRTID